MLACVDVDYPGDEGPAVASCVVYEDWDSSDSHEERVALIPRVAPYTPGQFYQRELPCILQVLEKVQTPLDAILVDGHVWLDDEGTPGLGAHLYCALEEQTPVIGIAKNPFGDSHGQRRVLRGQSTSRCSSPQRGLTSMSRRKASAACTVRIAYPAC